METTQFIGQSRPRVVAFFLFPLLFMVTIAYLTQLRENFNLCQRLTTTVMQLALVVVFNSHQYSFRIIAVSARTRQTCSEKVIFKFKTFADGSSQREETHQICLLAQLLHWLLKCGDILTFDLEKCQARIIKGPVKKTSTIECNIWFGGVQDSPVFCKLSKFEIVMFVYDMYILRHGKFSTKLVT